VFGATENLSLSLSPVRLAVCRAFHGMHFSSARHKYLRELMFREDVEIHAFVCLRLYRVARSVGKGKKRLIGAARL
jgi:hypothetical protein